MRFSKLIKTVFLIVPLTVVLTATLVIANKVRRTRSEIAIASTKAREQTSAPSDWSKIQIQDGVIFYVPPSFMPGPDGQDDGYRRFRSADMELLMDYGLTQHVTVCVAQNNQMQASAIKVEPTKIDGKDARIQRVDKIPFNLEDDASLAVKGFLICVPNVGDDAHEFSIVGKYKSPEDYQTLSRIVESVKFINKRG